MLARCNTLSFSRAPKSVSSTFLHPRSAAPLPSFGARSVNLPSQSVISVKAPKSLPSLRFASASAETAKAQPTSTEKADKEDKEEGAATVESDKKKRRIKKKKEKVHTPIPHPAATPIQHLDTLKEPAFAVVFFNGKQHKVSPGDVLVSTRIIGAPVGANILFGKVLLIGTKHWTALGTPLLKNAYVSVAIEEQTLAKKVLIFKKKRRKNYRRLRGHRQPITTIRVLDIIFDVEEFRSNVRYAKTSPNSSSSNVSGVAGVEGAEEFTVRAPDNKTAVFGASPVKGILTVVNSNKINKIKTKTKTTNNSDNDNNNTPVVEVEEIVQSLHEVVPGSTEGEELGGEGQPKEEGLPFQQILRDSSDQPITNNDKKI